MKLLLFTMLFFVLSALLIISNNNLAMYKQENIGKFSELYLNWINTLYLNAQILTGEVVKLDWLPSYG